jgi:uncharacterized protein YaiE (UPF0345 family)
VWRQAASAPMSGGDEATIMVKAQYAYTTSEPNELSFTEGALIKVRPRSLDVFFFFFFFFSISFFLFLYSTTR